MIFLHRSRVCVVYVCINGSFFGANQSYSLVKYNHVVTTSNIKSVNRNYNGTATPYYPTRAAFGINHLGIPSATWIYHVGSGNNNIYSYPLPANNAEGSSPEPMPSEIFPSGGTVWDVVSAIGGAPMLLHHGKLLSLIRLS
ncbi:MAG: hypothetical protein H7Z13_19680 [Ferruginibacter sp.]|nr:hypothetical protein [Ferruginibacter sp.]